MMEKQVNNEGDSCPYESPPTKVPDKNNKIGRLKIRTPAEMNKEYELYDEISPAPASPDQLRAFSFSEFLRPSVSNSPPFSIESEVSATVSTTSQLSPAFSTTSQLKFSKPPEATANRLREPSNVIAPKRKSKYPGFDFSNFQSIVNGNNSNTPAVVNLYDPAIQKKVGGRGNISTQFDVNLGQLQCTKKSQKPCPRKSRRGLKGRTAGFGETGNLSPSQDNRLKEHRVSEADARNIAASWKKLKPSIKPTESDVLNEGQGTTSAPDPRPGAAGPSLPQIIQEIIKSPKLQTGQNEKLETTGLNLRRENSVSTPSAFSAAGNSTDLQAAVKNKRSIEAKSVKNKPPVQRRNTKRKYPGFDEVSRLHESNTKKKYPGFGEVANSSDSHVIEKTKYKNMPIFLNETAKPTGFVFYRENDQGASGFSPQSKPVLKTLDATRRFPHGINTDAMKAKRNSPEVSKVSKTDAMKVKRNAPEVSKVSKTANSVTLQEKLKSISAIRELNEISRSGEEDWDFSLRQYIPVERYPNLKNRKVRTAHRGFGGVSSSDKSHEKKKSSKSDINGGRQFEKGNRLQRKIGGRKGINCSSNSIEIIELNNEDFTEKTDENANVNIQEERTSETFTRNNEEVSTNTDTEDDGREKLLAGVVFTISGYEDPLRGKLVRKAVAMGARYRTGWTKDCSHLICGFKGTFKYLQAKGRGNIVHGTWIEDCYKSRKKIDWKDYMLSEEKDDQESKEETTSPVARLRFLTGMEVLVKESSLVPQLLGEAGFVVGMYQGWVKVLIHGQGQFLLSPSQLEHLLPEVGDKAKYCVEGQEEDVVEVLRVEKEKGIAVVCQDGYRGAAVWLKNLCRVYDD